jgi:hypothetical protein
MGRECNLHCLAVSICTVARGAAELARPRPKRASRMNRPWLALLLLLPWALLMAGAGIHNHPLALTDTPAAAGSPRPLEAPKFDQDRVPSRDASCIACLWLLHSGATFSASPDEPAVLPAGGSVLARQVSPPAAHAWTSAARAPPLS